MFQFYKYEAAGNDFIMIDDRLERFPLDDHLLVERMCDRHFGIGADGLILIRPSEKYDFEMCYFNADGKLGSFCGNGGRATFLFAQNLGIVESSAQFMAYDGLHEAHYEGINRIALKMNAVSQLDREGVAHILDTGSPHWVEFVDDLDQMDVVAEGRARRNSERFKEEGINVNFIEAEDQYFRIRTYERGVEDETLACGTGITAAALVIAETRGMKEGQIEISAVGGDVSVRFLKEGNVYDQIWLVGPASKVFEGSWNIA